MLMLNVVTVLMLTSGGCRGGGSCNEQVWHAEGVSLIGCDGASWWPGLQDQWEKSLMMPHGPCKLQSTVHLKFKPAIQNTRASPSQVQVINTNIHVTPVTNNQKKIRQPSVHVSTSDNKRTYTLNPE